ncbi:MAG: S8 family serine peptidase [Bdellovibrionales bacterium]|nr:S8 family serine peptidase [Bdellovibrionales bacterium]
MKNAGRNLRRAFAIWVCAATSVSAVAGTHLYLQNETVALTNVSRKLNVQLRQGRNLFVVQYKERIQATDLKVLKEMGVDVFRYLPDDALLVWSDTVALKEMVSKQDRINAIIDFKTEYKLSSSIERPSVFNKTRTVVLNVVAVSEPLSTEVAQELKKRPQVEVLDESGRFFRVEASFAQLREIANLRAVEWVEEYQPMQTMVLPLQQDGSAQTLAGDFKDLTGFETGTKIMKFDAAWALGYTGKGEVVAVGDTGLDTGEGPQLHVDFRNNVGGAKFGLFAKDWSDPMGHGTHVSGSVMSSGEASGGLLKGGAFEAAVFAEGMWSPMLNNLTVPSKLADLFDAAMKAGARVQTNSWGSQSKGVYDNMSAQVDEYMWNHPEMLILFAAGNSGRDDNKDGRIDANSVSSPGTAKNALTVGASENYLLQGGIQRPLRDLLQGKPWSVEPLASDTLSNNENGVAAFSSIGPTNDGRRKPDIVAPGTNIVSNCSHVSGASPLWGNYNQDYCYSGGTSMSTPLTAGAAAVARQFLKSKGMNQPSAALVKGLLLHTAFDMYPGQYGEVGRSQGQEMLTPGPNNNQGYGRVDMARLTDPNGAVAYFDETSGIGVGESREYSFDSQGYKEVRVTLVYTDYPGSPSAGKTLVNDLDLVVTDGSGTSRSVSSRVDNNEQVLLKSPSDGPLKIVVKGVNVPQGKGGKQPYALLISGI